MFRLNSGLIFILFALWDESSSSLVTSCTGRSFYPWNTHMVAANIESWLRTGATVTEENGDISSRLFHQHNGFYTQHIAHYNDVRLDDQENKFMPLKEFNSIGSTGPHNFENVSYYQGGYEDEEGDDDDDGDDDDIISPMVAKI